MKKIASGVATFILTAFVGLVGIVTPSHAAGVTCANESGVVNTSYSGSPTFQSGTPISMSPTAGQSFGPTQSVTTQGFTSAPTFSVVPSRLPTGLVLNSATGQISGTPNSATAVSTYTLQAQGPAVSSDGTTPITFCMAINFTIEVLAAQQQQNQNVSLSFTSATHTPSTSLSSLAAGDNFPGYAVSFSGVSGGTYDSFNTLIGDPVNGRFYTVPGANGNSRQTMSAWDPNGSNCGITSITRGGSSLSASSGAFCGKMTYVSNGQTQYWVRVELGSASNADIFFTVAPGTFVVANPSNADQFATFLLRNDSATNTNYSARAFQLLTASTVGSASPSGSSTVLDTTIVLPQGIGQPIAGQTVGVTARNLALSTNYSITLRSTPQILEQGITTTTFMDTTVTIPAGLEPGWHSITFSAVRSDGVATEQVGYFKINESGILLQTSAEVPAELAFTAAPQPNQWALGVLLTVIGMGILATVYVYRRRVFEMVYVLTARGGHYEIELIEQPKKPRYLPLRKV